MGRSLARMGNIHGPIEHNTNLLRDHGSTYTVSAFQYSDCSVEESYSCIGEDGPFPINCRGGWRGCPIIPRYWKMTGLVCTHSLTTRGRHLHINVHYLDCKRDCFSPIILQESYQVHKDKHCPSCGKSTKHFPKVVLPLALGGGRRWIPGSTRN